MAAALPVVLVTTCLGVFLAQLDTSVVNLALKHIGAELGSSITQLQWVVDGYNLAYAAFLLTGGTLGDIFGRRRLFMIGVALFTAGSLICGIAPDNATMIAGRTLTGLGAAFEMPTSLAILSDAYPDGAQRARAIGVWASCNGLAWVVGPTMGGVIVGHIGWRWIFLLAVPIGLLASVLCLSGVPKSRCQNGRSIDALGQILAVSMLGTLSVAFIEGPHWGWNNLATIGCLAAAVCTFACFAIVEMRTEHPLLPLTIFRSRAFSAASVAAAGMTFGMYAHSRHCFDRIRLLVDRRRLGLQYRPVAFGRRIGCAEGARGCGCWRHQHGANDRRYARSCRAWRHLCSARRSEPRRSATDRGGSAAGVCRRRDQRNSWCAGGLALDPQ
jgi:EmrB/QacA subfamily drug resistance transporter